MIDVMHNRQKDFPWFVQKDILLIGAGGIGSYVAFLLARINHKLFIYDPDYFETHNLGGQLARTQDIGQRKTNALISLMRSFNNGYIYMSSFGTYNATSIVMPITILGLDNMATRKIAVQKWYDAYIVNKGENPILIDGRLEGEQGIIYTLRTENDYDRWMAEFFDDDEEDAGSCTMRSTSYNGMMIAANIVAILNNFIANEVAGDDLREVPYKLEYGFPGLVYDIIK